MTFSLLTRDVDSGHICWAVASLFTAVGAVVPWVRDGVGAVMTQSYADPALALLILEELAAGKRAEAALADGLGAYPGPAEPRQLAVLDADGNLAQFTGAACYPIAAHLQEAGVAVQGNILASEDVLPAMLRAWRDTADRPTAQRLLAALRAAQAAGGDARGQEAAALGVRPWRMLDSRLLPVDLRVDSHVRPLDHLARLLTRWEAFERGILR